MNIKDSWEIDDEVSGLSIKVIPGENLDKLQIRSANSDVVRDFWFTKDGTFDGTGAFIEEGSEDKEEVSVDG